jgi:hypothetical protein
LVKFSPAGNSPVDQRLRDLLVYEHLALQTVADTCPAAAKTQVFIAAGRVFMESERFDCTAQGGRIGRVSLQVYDAEYVGEMDNHRAATLPEWPQTRALAAVFWQAVVRDTRVSAGFRAIAAA